MKYTPPTYTLLDEMMASNTEPTPMGKKLHQLGEMWQALRSIEQEETPKVNDWRVCSDAVNFMETLVLDMKVAEDTKGLLHDATVALVNAANRSLQGHAIRLDAAGIFAVRSTLEDYAEMLNLLSHRTMVRCYRLTAKRVQEVQRGKRRAHDVVVVAL